MSTRNHGNVIDLDTILTEIGQFGKYQRYNFLLIALPIVFSGIYGGNYVFTAANVDYRCRIPECEKTGGAFLPDWLPDAIPIFDDSPQKCERYPLRETEPGVTVGPDNGTFCPAEMFDQENEIGCDGKIIYASNDTVVAEFNLGCQDWKRTFIGTAHSIGLFASLAFVGIISDRFGRKIALIMTAVMAGVMGLIRSFTTTYLTFVVFEFLDPALGSGVYSAGFVLALELVGPDRRVISGALVSTCYAIGQILLATAAWALPYWRTLTQVVYAPSLLIFTYYWLVEESVRWLLSKGQKDKAAQILETAASTNGVVISQKSIESLFASFDRKLEVRSTEEIQLNTKKTSLVLQVLKSTTILSRLVICSFWWITVTFVYYGLSINAVSLAGNVHANYMLVSAIEIPGYLVGAFALDKFGRKHSMMTAFLICGVACISFPFIPTSLSWVSLILFLIGKFAISLAFSSLYIYTSELFPTNVRHSLLATCSMVGRIGNMVAPQTPLLAFFMPALPSLLFGATSIISAFLMLFTPETIGTRLPDTIREAENITSMQRYNTSGNRIQRTQL